MAKVLAPSPDRIRNICILAHVDHGKTSLSDSFVASDGIISTRMAGKMRYLDSREDEQLRGITMKSSAITLAHEYIAPQSSSGAKDGRYYINLVDSPGHVDFSGEVEAALRVTDGALLVVDVVEGVCIQTVKVLRAALGRGIRPLLVLNKMDRLITELQLSTVEAYQAILKVLAELNVIMGVRATEMMIRKLEGEDMDSGGAAAGDWDIEYEDETNESGYFSPERGNVIFCSATDGWGFRLDHFAKIYSQKFGISRTALERTLWGDYYISAKRKSIVRGSSKKTSNAKPMFVQFILDTLWATYEAFGPGQSVDMRLKVVSSLGIVVNDRDIRHKDRQLALQAALSSWMPVAKCAMSAVVENLPSPVESQRLRISSIWPYDEKSPSVSESDACKQKAGIEMCDQEAPLIAFLTKTIPNEKRTESKGTLPSSIGIVRVFAGCLQPGMTVNIFGPKFNSNSPDNEGHTVTITIQDTNLLLGRDCEPLDGIGPGMLCGVTGIDNLPFKFASLSTIDVSSFLPLQVEHFAASLASSKLVQVAVEPVNPLEMATLQDGLVALNRSDPAVETFVLETGEHVVAASGELHLEQCLKDLREMFAKVDIEVSAPLVPMRETIVGTETLKFGTVTFNTGPLLESSSAIDNFRLKVRAIAIPDELARYIEDSADSVRAEIDASSMPSSTDRIEKRMAESPSDQKSKDFLEMFGSKIASLGPKRAGPNVLVIEDTNLLRLVGISPAVPVLFGQSKAIPHGEETSGVPLEVLKAVVTGFQMATRSGPLCEEPMHGIAFIVEDVAIDSQLPAKSEDDEGLSRRPVAGQVISASKSLFREAMKDSGARVMEAMMRLEVEAPAESLGGLHMSLSKRRGRALSEEMKDGGPEFKVEALLPVIESFGFTDTLRKQTSGGAHPQMVPSHWETLEQDPFWEPTTEEELEDFSKEDSTLANNNLAAKLVRLVRKRKGLRVKDHQVVERAERQRTLGKNK